jgi:abequosyltransferase
MVKNIENSSLSICIPTFNRADVLYVNIIELIEQLEEFNTAVNISDNCSTDNTPDIVKKLEISYPFISYFRQPENIHDRNFPFVLRQSKAKYSWLLGDKSRINKGGIKRIMEIISENDYDLIIVNDQSRVHNLDSRTFNDPVELLEDLGWHMTDISSLIFSKKLIEEINFERFLGTSFLHTAGIFEAFAFRKINVLWLNENILLGSKSSVKSGWHTSNFLFSIFIDSWASAILSLPPFYPLESKSKCIKQHGIMTGIFSLGNFAINRAKGFLGYWTFTKYRKFFKFICNTHPIWILIISLVPKWIFKMYFHLKLYFQREPGLNN